MQWRPWMSHCLAATLACPLTALPVVAQQKAAPTDVAAVRVAIERINAEWAAASLRHDAATIAAQYTEDAIIMGPGAPAGTGRAMIQAGLAEMPDILEPKLTVAEVEVLGTTAIERGNFHMKFAMPGQPPLTDDGKYIVVWKRGSDGVWRRHREVFNSDLPAPPVRAAPGDSVFVVVNHVKAEMRAEFERQASEVWIAAWRKLGETDPMYRSFLPTIRLLAATKAEADGTYTYLVMADPHRHGANYGARGTLDKLYPPEKASELIKAWVGTFARPQESYWLIQQK